MFRRLKGNARGCLLFEPMFLVPYSMFLTYSSLYMLEQGLSEKQIGFLASLNLVLQIFSSLISGYLTDRLGRKKALLIFDLLSWTFATLLWMIAHDFWLFLLAAVFNSLQKVPNTAWYCLLVEETESEIRSLVFTVLQFISVASGLFAPLGGLLVHHASLVPAERIMYGIACVSMTLMFFLRNRATTETDIGRRKMQENAGIRLSGVIRQYGSVIRSMATNTPLMLITSIYILFQFQLTMRNTYFSIYVVRTLHFSEAFIAWFPAITSLVTLALMLVLTPRIHPKHATRYMLAGLFVGAIAQVLLLLSPPESMLLIILSTIMTAAGGMVVYPFLEASVQNAIEDDNRAGVFSIISVVILVFVSPAGVIGGWTYSLDPRLPFVLIIVSFLVSAALLVVLVKYNAKKSHYQSKQGAE